ncbi:hypothetical protein ACHAXM_007103 [Skeletonema potamos]
MMNHHQLLLVLVIQLLCTTASHALKLTSLGSLYEGAALPPSTPPNEADGDSYGVDRSFPIQHDNLLDDGPFDHRERQHFYDNFMAGCWAHETSKQKSGLCNQAEADRIATNLLQPSTMRNYTQLGYEKVLAPTKLVESLRRFWMKKGQNYHPTNSNFDIGSTYINHWETHHHIMNIDDDQFQSKHLRTLIWDETKPILEEWVGGVELSPSSLCGVHIFTDKTVMPHRLDTLPFVINAIIHVADEVDTHWPIELYGHDGKSRNITLEVGEMLLYEGQSIIIGRPYPMQGKYHADLFVSFEPLGYSRQHDHHLDDEAEESWLSSLYLNSWKDWALAHKSHPTDKMVVPSYIDKNSDAYGRWYQSYPKAKLRIEGKNTVSVHTAAAGGDLDILRAIEKENSDALFKVDDNGWTALQ